VAVRVEVVESALDVGNDPLAGKPTSHDNRTRTDPQQV
jgi:hypothetical protein